jgi:hypothetical protein
LIVLEALIFQRVSNVKPDAKNPAIGTWNQQSAYHTTRGGKTTSSFNASDTRMLIVTPTHWMRMDHKNKTFEGVSFGTYRSQGDAVFSNLDFSSYPFKKGTESKYIQKVKGNRLQLSSEGSTAQGEAATFYYEYEKAK